MRICFLPASFDAVGMYRCLFPAFELRKLGHEAKHPPVWEKLFVENNVSHEFFTSLEQLLLIDADVYVFQQRDESGVRELQAQLRSCGKAVVGESDDNYLGIPGYHSAAQGSTRSDHRNRFNVLDALKETDAIQVSTPFLAELYSRYNEHIRVLPNFLQWEMWADVQPQYEVERDRLRVGWYGSLKMRRGDLQMLNGVIQPWLERNRNVDFVSTVDVLDFLKIPSDQRIVLEPVDFRKGRLPEDMVARFDIGLVPLEMNNFNEAKSHLKGMEMNACGIPVIASPTESYRSWVVEGENGFLARKPRDWIRQLDVLASDGDLRREMGRKARLRASESTYEANIGLWETFYKEVAGRDTDFRVAKRAIFQFGAVQKPEELGAMVGVVRELKPKTIVEIGSAVGGTLTAWMKVADPEALIVPVDMPCGDFGGGGIAMSDKVRKRVASTKQPGQHIHLVIGDSHDPRTLEAVVKALGGREVDFLFIDGDHRYDGVRQDYEMYSPLVRAGGLIGFHDIVRHPLHPDCEVDRFWSEVRRGRNVRELIKHGKTSEGMWGGIGVVAA